MTSDLVRLTHYLPIVTTILSALFAAEILGRYRTKPESHHLLWWGIGVAVYGVGTLVESLTTLLGWNVILFKAWYISGALLGGAPLALGTVFLLMGPVVGRRAVWAVIAVVGITSLFVLASPIHYELVDSQVLSSEVLGWQRIRLVSPFINGLAALFLIGGAILSAIRYAASPATRHRVHANIAIAVGGLLPGIGGLYSRLGHTEVLYVGELLGIVLIWFGYRLSRQPAPALASA